MKLVHLKCPNCNSDLVIHEQEHEAVCESCGSKFYVDNENQIIEHKMSENAGYEFEKGRQRAQEEKKSAQKNKRKPVFIIIGITVVACIAILFISMGSDKSDTKVQTTENNTQAEKSTSKNSTSSGDLESQNALDAAKEYLTYNGYSYKGLSDQLSYDGYSEDAIQYAVDNCGADWQEQAIKLAEEELQYASFSSSGLVEQLTYDGFSKEEAETAVEALKDINWNEQAVKSADSSAQYNNLSKKGTVEQLEYEGFSNEQATYGADNCSADWNEEAAAAAQDYLDYNSMSKKELLEQLVDYDGFSEEEASYALEKVGY